MFNGKPTWLINSYAPKAIGYHQDNDKFWSIGRKTDIGKNRAMISCKASQDPDDSNNVLKYVNLNGEWIKDNENDVNVQSIFDETIETSVN